MSLPALRLKRSIVVLAAAGVLSVSGCSFLGGLGDAPVRDATSDAITDGGNLDVFTLKVGDCFDDTSDTTISELPVVPCADAHDEEVYFEFSLPDGAFPGDDAAASAADERCTSEFDGFAGIAYADSSLDYSYLVPTSDSWDGGDRVIQCTAYDPSGKVTGSLKGAAR